MSLDEGLLEKVAQDGSMDYSRWPGQLEPLLQRLDEIVFNVFPIPKLPADGASSFTSQPSSFPSSYLLSDSLQSSNKENAPPSTSASQTPYNGAPASTLEYTSAGSDLIPNSQPSHADSSSLPPPLLSLLSSIKGTLRAYFVSKPPHTIQRLAELILRPTRQYRTLPAYLRAVDRVTSVSSSANIFPLPRAGIPAEDDLLNGVINGSTSNFMITDESLGSDESLGGALLTPIPWLTNPGLDAVRADMIAEGAVPVRTDAAVTQGELIRQEQEAGLVANTQTSNSSSISGVEGEEDSEESSPQAEEIPHARGPSLLGIEDMGLQDGKGVEMTLSNPNKSQEEKDGMDVSGSAAEGLDEDVLSESKQNSSGIPEGDDDDIILDDVTANQLTTSTTGISAETESETPVTEQDRTG